MRGIALPKKYPTLDERRARCAADLGRINAAGIAQVKFRFGHMAAGHCSYSLSMDGKVIALPDAPHLPPDECEHPDQCGCRWQSWIPLLDEIE